MGNESLLGTQLATSAWQADKYYRPHAHSLSLMRQALSAIALSVRSDALLAQWAPPPPNGVLAVDPSDEFARLWSALFFLFSSPPSDAKEVCLSCGWGALWVGRGWLGWLGGGG